MFVVDSSTLNEFLLEDDQIEDPVTVHVFEDQTARDSYVESLRQTRPGAIGLLQNRER